MEEGNFFGDDFIRSLLLTLEHTDDAYDILTEYFEEIEQYERCTNLQKLKTMLYLNAPDEEEPPQSNK